MTKTQSIITDCGLLRVAFEWFNDRFAHQIEWCDGGRTIVLLKSQEGTPEDSWPSSPPFQQVEPHGIGDGAKSLLAVGLAGTSHWSASIEPVNRRRPKDESRIRIDVACRMKDSTPQLGSTYHILDDVSTQASENGVILNFTADVSIEIVTKDALTQSGQSITVAPQHLPAEKPATARWMYDFMIKRTWL